MGYGVARLCECMAAIFSSLYPLSQATNVLILTLESDLIHLMNLF
jgi:hypothetical protein